MEWMDLEGFLKDRKAVTKEEIQDYMDQNKVVVEEVEKRDEVFPISRADVESVAQNKDGEWVVTFKEEAFGEYIYPDAATEIDAIDLAIDELRQSEMLNSAQPDDATKFGLYVLPGGENYRELLLTMPEKTERRSYSVREIGKTGRYVIVDDATENAIIINGVNSYVDKETAERIVVITKHNYSL